MTPLDATMILRSHVHNYRIDNGDEYGQHYPFRREVRRAASVLRGCGGPRLANFRQMLAWADSDAGLDAIVDADPGKDGATC